MKTTRKENEFVLRKEDMVYEFVPWAIATMIAILMVIFLENYFIASILVFEWMKYFGSEKMHFYKNKFSKFILRKYPYLFKVTLSLICIITIVLSWSSAKAFIYSIVFSIFWKEYMNVFKQRKSLT